MKTTIFQKFISRYADTFTLIEITHGPEYATIEIVPAAKVGKLDEDDFLELVEELCDSRNEKASWSEGEEDFDEEDARAAFHQDWTEINSDLDKMGM